MQKTLNSIDQTGHFEDAVLDWRNKPEDDQSWGNFKAHFKPADVKRKRKVTTKNGGYCSSNKYAATAAASAALSASQAPPPQTAPRTCTKACNITINWSYGWRHGLSRDPTHNSVFSPHKRDGHESIATIDNMLGGNRIIAYKVGEKLNGQFMFTYHNRTGRKPLK
jgi:hypothetical protein